MRDATSTRCKPSKKIVEVLGQPKKDTATFWESLVYNFVKLKAK
jgi:hypothetical protein